MNILSYGLFSSLSSADVELSPYSFTSNNLWNGDRKMWLYIPEGYYNNPSRNYPLIVYGHGYGGRSNTYDIDILLNEGIPKYIYEGDLPEDVIIACPQITLTDTDFDVNHFDLTLHYITGTTGLRVDPNRIYITGLSGGAFWCRLVSQNRPNKIAAVVAASGNYGSGWDWSEQVGIGHFWIHGTNDSEVTNGLQSFTQNSNSVTREVPFNTLNLWNVGHNATAWHTNLYNRSTATFDYVKYLKKHSKDATERAFLFVQHAEETNLIEDYRAALLLVNRLSNGSTKTNLLSILSIIKSNIDNGGRRFVLDFGATSSTGNTNVITTAQAGQGATNLIDDEGNSSSIDWIVNSQHTSQSGNKMSGVSRSNGEYFGYPIGVYSDGLRIQGGITGSTSFTSLDNSKLYNVRVYHTFGAGNNNDKSELTVKINGTTKSQYSELNNTQYIEFTNVSPSSNEIEITAYPSGTGSPIRNSQICTIELFEPA